MSKMLREKRKIMRIFKECNKPLSLRAYLFFSLNKSMKAFNDYLSSQKALFEYWTNYAKYQEKSDRFLAWSTIDDTNYNINMSFAWLDTPEGFVFWEKIFDEVEGIRDKPLSYLIEYRR